MLLPLGALIALIEGMLATHRVGRFALVPALTGLAVWLLWRPEGRRHGNHRRPGRATSQPNPPAPTPPVAIRQRSARPSPSPCARSRRS